MNIPADPAPFAGHLDFDGAMPRQVLECYLARSISMAGLLMGRGHFDDNLRMLKNIGALFAGRAISHWGRERSLIENLARGRTLAARIHTEHPRIMLQAAIFEVVTPDVACIDIPPWVFEAFALAPEKRTFRYENMLFPDGLYVNHWPRGGSVPDITRLETRLWFYFLAVSYLNIGIESIHWGQIALIGRHDPELDNWWDLLGRVRAYAAHHARRRFVLNDAHVSSGVGCFGLSSDAADAPGGYRTGDRLLLDVHALPLRIREIASQPRKADLAMGHLDSLYGRSLGGVTPSGWRCDSLPYLVEFDNYGNSGHPGESVVGKIDPLVGIASDYWIWGWDEITWFANQSEEERNRWLWYAWRWVREHDPNGYVQMPGMRHLTDSANGLSDYFANIPSEACPEGQNQEETIGSIWDEHSKALNGGRPA
jgi:hypothetical protein